MMSEEQRAALVVLKQEIMLQVNQRLYEADLISKAMYEMAKIRIVSGT